jgi:dTMP kinase
MIGKLINLEGCDAAGKGSQVKLILKYYEQLGKKVKHIHFPMYGYSEYSEMISKFLRGEYGDNDSVDSIFVANIYAMDRYMYKPQLMNDLQENDAVIMDRYVFSNVAYQCSKTKNIDDKNHMMNGILNLEFEFLKLPYPDSILFFDVPIEEIDRRLNLGRTGEDREYLNGKQDIHEVDINFQSKVRNIYLSMNNIKNFNIIKTYNEKGILSPEDLFKNYKNLI